MPPTRRAPATSSAIDAATWATTKAPRSVQRNRPPPARRGAATASGSFRPHTRSGRVTRSAGPSPNATPATIERAALNRSTRQFIPSDGCIGSERLAEREVNTRAPQAAASTPAPPPSSPSRVLSTRSCLTSRHLVEPSAMRIDSSWPRFQPPASRRPARLAQPTSRTRPATPISAAPTGYRDPSSLGCIRTCEAWSTVSARPRCTPGTRGRAARRPPRPRHAPLRG